MSPAPLPAITLTRPFREANACQARGRHLDHFWRAGGSELRRIDTPLQPGDEHRAVQVSVRSHSWTQMAQVEHAELHHVAVLQYLSDHPQNR